MRVRLPGWALSGVGAGVIAVAAGVTLLAVRITAAGVLLVVAGGLLLALFAGLAIVSGAVTRGGSIEPTSRVLVRRAPPSPRAGTETPPMLRWIGGANLPAGNLGRLNLTIPLAVLGCTGPTLRLQLRTRRLVRARGAAADLVWQPNELVRIFPVRGRFLPLNQGVAIQSMTHVTYFWTFDRETILATLEDLGYPVDWSEHYVALLAA